ncbi:MAG TPA: penicillin-binding transpeptidase domain-containing protein, partial [Longimicrobiales bacterium]|nr:penicillin-binding transpeptidase domain-containing protein [Longimicrobiales bacterium]
IQAAADEYFAKSASALTLGESAMLAALPRAPSRLNPRANREAALEGRELVLRRMSEQGLISEAERAEAAEERLVLKDRNRETPEVAPYFVEAVRRQLEEQLGSALYTEGYTIHTTLDLGAQQVAEEQLTAQLSAMEAGRFGSYVHTTYNGFHADTTRDAASETTYLQGAVVVMDARTGDVLALVGGRDYDDSEFNRATQARRQPGSAFKPFVYAAAINAGYSPAHRLIDRPLRYVMDNGQVWEPGNYDGSFSGVVSMRQALTYSKNVATVRLANEVGMSRVLGMAEQMGLGTMPSNPSVVLGTAEVTPLQLTAAYAAFATLGHRPEPRFVTRVSDRNGVVVWQQQPHTNRVIDPAVAFITTSMMQDVVDRGTGTGVRGAGFRGPAAGKTGTTQDAADVWFVGFTPELVATIWIGLDKRARILRGATGGEIAAPLWGRIMKQFPASGSGWSPPSGVEQGQVDDMGNAVAAGCTPQGATRQEFFLRGSTPMASCYSPSDYAYGDTLGYDQYSYGTWGDSLAAAPDTAGQVGDDGWWERMRRRVFERDSARVATPRPDSTPVAIPTPRRDSVRPPPAGQPIGTPVRPPARDTARPRPDSTRPPPPPPPDSVAADSSGG